MTEFAELLQAISALLWPSLIAISILCVFRADLKDAFKRITRAKVFGQEIELQELRETVEQGLEEVTDPETVESHDRHALPTTEGPIQEVFRMAEESPQLALMLLAREVEKEARDLLRGEGSFQGRPMPISRVIEYLDDRHDLPPHVVKGLRLFVRVRNKVVHGGAASHGEVLSAIDSGVIMLRTLNALPRSLDPADHAMLETAIRVGDLSQLRDRLGVLVGDVKDGTQRLEIGIELIGRQTKEEQARFRPLVSELGVATEATESLLGSLRRCRELMQGLPRQ